MEATGTMSVVKQSAERIGALALLSVAADAVGILSFAGLVPGRDLRLAVVVALVGCGVLLAATQLAMSLKNWWMVSGSFRPKGYHRARISAALVALAASLLMLVLAAQAVRTREPKSPKENPVANPASGPQWPLAEGPHYI